MDDYITTSNGLICWQLEKMPFSEDVIKTAEIELNEKQEDRAKAVESFRQMILAKADFNCNMEELFLLRFLRARKFNQERSFRLLRKYYECLVKFTAIFGDVKPSSIEEYIFRNGISMLQHRDPQGRPVILIQMCEANPGGIPFNIIMRIAALTAETLLNDPVTQVEGIIAILDFRDVGMKFVYNLLTPSNLYTVFVLLQDCLPARIKQLHVVYGGLITRIVYDICKFFMTAKLKKRLFFHGDNMGSLHKHIPAEILPEEYGGVLPVDRSSWGRKLMTMEQAFLDRMKEGFAKSS